MEGGLSRTWQYQYTRWPEADNVLEQCLLCAAVQNMKKTAPVVDKRINKTPPDTDGVYQQSDGITPRHFT